MKPSLALIALALFACTKVPVGMDGSIDTQVDTYVDGMVDVTSEVSDAIENDAGADADVPQNVAALLLTGHMQRRMLSCDLGETWVYDVSADDSVRCFEDDFDCDHHAFSNNGVGYGNGRFVMTSGWGRDSSGLRGSDGSSEFSTLLDTDAYSGVAYGNGVWLAGSRLPATSTDGINFVVSEERVGGGRGAFFADVMGGRHVMYADGPRVMLTGDNGVTYWEADLTDCAFDGRLDGVGGGDTLLLFSTSSSTGCRSADGGLTWTSFAFSEDDSVSVRGVVWKDGAFLATSLTARYRSLDGSTWEATATAEAPSFRRVLTSDGGPLFGIVSPWGGFYERSALYRSDDDGISWEKTGGSDQLNGHPIRYGVVGEVNRELCTQQ